MEVSIHEAKTNLSKLIREALHGEEVIISRGQLPVVKLTPLETALPRRALGQAPELIEYMAEDFNAEMEDFDEDESSLSS